MQPWPRRLINFPIILIATILQLVIGVALLVDYDAHFATEVHVLWVVFQAVAPLLLISAAFMAITGFFLRRKVHTLLFLVPQQILLFLSAGSSFKAIWQGHFADGVVRSHAFIMADQAPVILIAFFHAWAIILILVYGADN
jgi:hypothetical protein